jgi:hypothetical protein
MTTVSLTVTYTADRPDPRDKRIQRILERFGGHWIGSGYFFPDRERDIQFDLPLTALDAVKAELSKVPGCTVRERNDPRR